MARGVEAFCREHGVTPAEQAVVMQLVHDAASNVVIGKRLGLSVNTVANHLKSISTRVGTHSRDELLVRLLQSIVATTNPLRSNATPRYSVHRSPMPNLASILKDEIRRLARKEMRAEVASLKSTSTQHRRDLAALKRANKELSSKLARLEAASASRRSTRVEADDEKQVRFSPDWVLNHREKLGLSQADYGALVGVSGVTIYNWENGRSRPRAQQLAMWGAVKKLGKREAMRQLEEG